MTADEEKPSVLESIKPILGVLGPGTVTIGILYYFGWARTRALFAYFGIDANALGFSTSDYVLRSAEVLWPALTAVVLLLLVLAAVRAEAVRFVRSRSARKSRLIAAIGIAVGSALLLLALADLVVFHFSYRFLAPVEIVIALVLISYARHLSVSGSPHAVPGGPARPRSISATVLVLALIVLNAFWAAALFADQSGQGRAQHLESTHFAEMPDVLLYSRTRLHVDAGDVVETDLGKGYEPFRFRYSGLKLLARTAGISVLIPYSWSTGNAYALVLRTSDDFLITFAPRF